MAVYFLALGAAVLFGAGSVVQQRVASTAPPGRSLRPGLLLWLVRQPVWLVGVGTAVVGNLLSGAALGLGSVALVQPLLVSRLLFALPLSAAWQRRRLAFRDWLGLVATAGGLAVFVAVGRPTPGQRHPPVWQWLVLVAAIGALTGALVRAARRLAPAREAAVLGAGAGMLFALQSAFTHAAVGGLLAHGVVGLLTDWSTYAVAAAALCATLLAQSAYEMAPLAAAYPPLASVEPLTGIAIGVGLLGTTLAVGGPSVGALAAGLAVMTAGIWLLATSRLVTGDRATMEQRRLEEEIAEVERCAERDLRRLRAAVTELEQCSPAPGNAAPVRSCVAEADGSARRLEAGLRTLAERHEQLRSQRAGSGAGAHAEGRRERADRPPEAELRARHDDLVARLTTRLHELGLPAAPPPAPPRRRRRSARG